MNISSIWIRVCGRKPFHPQTPDLNPARVGAPEGDHISQSGGAGFKTPTSSRISILGLKYGPLTWALRPFRRVLGTLKVT